ncbi:MAG: hypothetical protein IPM71_16160 [Bacteroidota bacterium]|nr:MAG: hypothetical protein IPM71_16160 [Bacteroidota bacterium]
MRKLMTLLLISFSIAGFSQKYLKSYDPYTAKNGHVYKVGDNIYITEPKNFNNEFLSLYTNKGLTSKADVLYIYTSSTGEKTIYDRRFKSYPIRYFLIQPDGKHIAALEINTLFNSTLTD